MDGDATVALELNYCTVPPWFPVGPHVPLDGVVPRPQHIDVGPVPRPVHTSLAHVHTATQVCLEQVRATHGCLQHPGEQCQARAGLGDGTWVRRRAGVVVADEDTGSIHMVVYPLSGRQAFVEKHVSNPGLRYFPRVQLAAQPIVREQCQARAVLRLCPVEDLRERTPLVLGVLGFGCSVELIPQVPVSLLLRRGTVVHVRVKHQLPPCVSVRVSSCLSLH